MTNKPPKTIETICPCCGQQAIFEFVFIWSIPGMQLMQMYNCNKCHTTRELQSLIDMPNTVEGKNNA